MIDATHLDLIKGIEAEFITNVATRKTYMRSPKIKNLWVRVYWTGA